MSERGVFAVDRGVFDHPKFQEDKPFLKVNAWLWLLAAAAWKPVVRRISGKDYHLARGQLVASTRYMAMQWQWSEARVRRFLDVLKTDAGGDAEIDAATDAGITVITIRKYDEYQRVSLPRDAANDASSDAGTDAEATQERRKEEDTKDTKIDTRSVATRPDLEPEVSEKITEPKPATPKRSKASEHPAFPRFWETFPRRDGPNPRKPAAIKFAALCAAGIDPEIIIAGAGRTAAHYAKRSEIGTRFVPQAVTWLNQERWNDDQYQHPSQVVLAKPEPDWDRKMQQFTSMPAHSRTWYGPGSEPGFAGCEVPAEIQRKYGFAPIAWVRRGDGKQFGHEAHPEVPP